MCFDFLAFFKRQKNLFLVDQETICAVSFYSGNFRLINSETSAFRVNLFQLLYCPVGRLEELIVENLRVKPSDDFF